MNKFSGLMATIVTVHLISLNPCRIVSNLKMGVVHLFRDFYLCVMVSSFKVSFFRVNFLLIFLFLFVLIEIFMFNQFLLGLILNLTVAWKFIISIVKGLDLG